MEHYQHTRQFNLRTPRCSRAPNTQGPPPPDAEGEPWCACCTAYLSEDDNTQQARTTRPRRPKHQISLSPRRRPISNPQQPTPRLPPHLSVERTLPERPKISPIQDNGPHGEPHHTTAHLYIRQHRRNGRPIPQMVQEDYLPPPLLPWRGYRILHALARRPKPLPQRTALRDRVPTSARMRFGNNIFWYPQYIRPHPLSSSPTRTRNTTRTHLTTTSHKLMRK